MLKIEFGLALLALVVAFAFPAVGSRFFAPVERAFARVACRQRLAVLLVGLLALTLRAALLPVLPIPEPVVHDEFGYLLAADTFAHGRLTNPTPAAWAHFETFSILMKPSYQCFAQPAQGMILAAGKIIGGRFFWGVWVSIGLMCAAICWMLQGWLPPAWALLGGLLAILRFGVFGYWANSYWGGAAGAIGGALVLGALPRIIRHRRLGDALLMGLGLATLANSRPYEGLVFSLPVAGALLVWMLGQHRPSIAVLLRRVIAPLCLVLAATAVAMGYYCWRVTGSPFRMPYEVEVQTYATSPYMIWQSSRPGPVYHDKVMRNLYGTRYPKMYAFARSPIGLAAKAIWFWFFYLGPVLSLPLVMVIFTLPYGFSFSQITKPTRFLLITFLTLLLGLELEVFLAPHYAAPATGLILALALIAMKRLQGWRWHGKPSGLLLARAVPAICLVMFTLRAAAKPLKISVAESYQPAWYETGPKSFGRAAILADLQRLPDRQLVIVRYEPDHNPFYEWVYNDADIDGSKVVWARDLGPADNQDLIRHFRGRTVWLLQADDEPPKLSRYPAISRASPGGM